MWPEHYPEKCPPEDSKDVFGIVFRFTNRTTPKLKDFMSYYELKPESNWANHACQARGLSVYTSEEDCKMALAAVPALRKKKICSAILSAESGVISLTPSRNSNNHKTLWPLISAEELANIFMPLEMKKVAHA